MTSLHAPGGATCQAGGDLQSLIARTRTFDALGHVFAVNCEDEALAALIEQAFAALTVPDEPSGWYSIRCRDDRFNLSWRGESVVDGIDRANVLAWLLLDVNRRAVVAADGDLVLHAGCVARDRRAIVVSGAPRCGKSTLVAALVAQQCDYLTDEAVPVELTSGRVRPFPRPALLDDRSLDLLPEIAALRSPPDCVTHKRMVVIKPRPDLLEHPELEVAMVLFPERDSPGSATMEPVSRGDAIVRLAENTFNFANHGPDAIDALALTLQDAVGYRIVANDPRAAASAALDALAVTAPRSAQHGGKVS